MINLLFQLFQRLSGQRKRQLFYIFLLMLIVSVLEILSIGAIIPFVGVLVDPDQILRHESFAGLLGLLNVTGSADLRFLFTLAFSTAIFFSSFARLTLLLMQSRIGYAIGADLGYQIYSSVLKRSYQEYIMYNSSETISAITKKTNSCVSSSIIPFMNVVASSITCIFIIAVLVFVDPTKTLLILSSFGLLYVLVWFKIRNKIKDNSQNISTKHDAIVKNVVEGLSSFRNVIIDGNAAFYLKIFHDSDSSLRRSLASNQISGESPKYFMEAFGMLMIAWFAYYSIKSGEILENLLPAIAVLVLGAQRILPVLQKGYAGWTQMKGEMHSLNDVINIVLECDSSVKQIEQKSKHFDFKERIALENVSFSYRESELDALNNISLMINKGDIVGITGKSGSGKSTLLDILLGLLEPTDGKVLVDDEVVKLIGNSKWYNCIAHVPQAVYLADTSIAENVAFGEEVSLIDKVKLKDALELVSLSNFSIDEDLLFESNLGENGINLSGGQIQRIGLARAIYRDKPVLLLDEATSSLDENTEAEVLSNLAKTGKTIIIITHKKTNLKFCNKTLVISNGKISRIEG